jgi:hypothetical protein
MISKEARNISAREVRGESTGIDRDVLNEVNFYLAVCHL